MPTTDQLYKSSLPDLRIVLLAIVLGTTLCFTNTYIGLQAGTVMAMPMQTALLGYGFFNRFKQVLHVSTSPQDVTLIEILAGSLGIAPFTSGFVGFIPALEFLYRSESNSTTSFTWAQLFAWSVATCALGIVVAAPFREYFIHRERLRFPSALSTGVLIGVLFKDRGILERTESSHDASPAHNQSSRTSALDEDDGSHPNDARGSLAEPPQDDDDDDAHDTDSAMKTLLYFFSASGVFSLFSYFFPSITALPMFGRDIAEEWLWTFDPSPTWLAYGVIIGPYINAFVLLGAFLGWGVLSPIAKSQGWAPGHVASWDDGARGWTVWPGIGLILGECAVSIVWAAVRSLRPWAQNLRPFYDTTPGLRREERTPLMAENANQIPRIETESQGCRGTLVSRRLLFSVGGALTMLYIIVVAGSFIEYTSFIRLLWPLALLPLAAFVSMRSLGETDNGASVAIGRVAQLLVGLITPSTLAYHIPANLLLGGVVESGASQAAQHMGGLKTASVTQTPPKAVFVNQLIGSFTGAFIATAVYRMYTSVEGSIGRFDMPDAHLWIVGAKLVYQEGLPRHAMSFAAVAFSFSAVCSAVKIGMSKHSWSKYIPSGLAMGIGMYLLPSISLSRFIGSIIYAACRYWYGISNSLCICAATGAILGQGIFALISLAFQLLGVPHM